MYCTALHGTALHCTECIPPTRPPPPVSSLTHRPRTTQGELTVREKLKMNLVRYDENAGSMTCTSVRHCPLNLPEDLVVME